MTDVVQQIQHPLIEEMEARHQVEMAELKQEWEAKYDEAYEATENANSSVQSQIVFLEEYKKNREKDGLPFTLSSLVDALNDFKLRRYEKEWDILSGVENLLRMIHTDVEIKTEVRTVFKVPPSLKNEINNLLNRYD